MKEFLTIYIDIMLKLKVKGLSDHIHQLIKDLAEHLQMYDPRLPEESQATGYHVVKKMVLMEEDMCTLEDFEHHKLNLFTATPVGYYLLSQIHPNARRVTLDAVNTVRKILRDGNASKVEILKKK